MENLETHILNCIGFNRHFVDVFTDEKIAVIYKTFERVTEFDEITKLV